MESIGVRELRQNASRYLARVAGGESFEITNHGQSVARLVPTGAATTRDDLISQGLLTPGRGDLLEWLGNMPHLPRPPGIGSNQEILDELRSET